MRELSDSQLLVLTGEDVNQLLDGHEADVMAAVESAYELHARGETSLPHSTFLRFPGNDTDRIIALPAFLGGDYPMAGVKWIASFPGNLERDLDRASAAIILNSARTGRPQALMEASIISARRTAASAALAGRHLMSGRETTRAGIVGCGLIGFEIVRFLRTAMPGIESLVLFDLSPERARAFGDHCRQTFGDVEIEIAEDLPSLLAAAPLVAFATTAGEPYVDDLSACPAGSAILHVSLRDLSPRVILAADNVVDDLDHVARARTSIHLAELEVGHRDFVRCSLGDILLRRAPARRDDESLAIFSPFGLGILDLAVARLVGERALAEGRGTVIEDFLPPRWTQRN